LFSIVTHASVIILLLLALDRTPRGGAPESVESAGIILNHKEEGGGQDSGDSTTAVSPGAAVEAPDLLLPELQPAPTLPAPNIVRVAQTLPANPTSSAKTVAQVRPGNPPAGLSFGSGSGTGDYAKVRVFGVEGTGNKFVYVFDRSSSMEGPPLAAAKRQLTESLKSLDEVHQFHIIFFNQRLKALNISGGGGRVAFATDRNKQLAANFIGGISADGGTDRFIALRQAFAHRPDVIFFLTDADDPMSGSELAEIAKLHERFGATICAIEFGRSDAEPSNNFLKELARQTGGQYGYVNAAKLGR
jgi:hypothetical protein